MPKMKTHSGAKKAFLFDCKRQSEVQTREHATHFNQTFQQSKT